MKNLFLTILCLLLCIFCVVLDIIDLSQYKGQYWIFGAIFLISFLVFLLKKYGKSTKNQLIILLGLIIFFVIIFFIEIKFSYLFRM